METTTSPKKRGRPVGTVKTPDAIRMHVYVPRDLVQWAESVYPGFSAPVIDGLRLLKTAHEKSAKKPS